MYEIYVNYQNKNQNEIENNNDNENKSEKLIEIINKNLE
jgi:hypothetical protein